MYSWTTNRHSGCGPAASAPGRPRRAAPGGAATPPSRRARAGRSSDCTLTCLGRVRLAREVGELRPVAEHRVDLAPRPAASIASLQVPAATQRASVAVGGIAARRQAPRPLPAPRHRLAAGRRPRSRRRDLLEEAPARWSRSSVATRSAGRSASADLAAAADRADQRRGQHAEDRRREHGADDRHEDLERMRTAVERAAVADALEPDGAHHRLHRVAAEPERQRLAGDDPEVRRLRAAPRAITAARTRLATRKTRIARGTPSLRDGLAQDAGGIAEVDGAARALRHGDARAQVLVGEVEAAPCAPR